jgi:hypothetical protein
MLSLMSIYVAASKGEIEKAKREAAASDSLKLSLQDVQYALRDTGFQLTFDPEAYGASISATLTKGDVSERFNIAYAGATKGWFKGSQIEVDITDEAGHTSRHTMSGRYDEAFETCTGRVAEALVQKMGEAHPG